jgi:hypothetical protein
MKNNYYFLIFLNIFISFLIFGTFAYILIKHFILLKNSSVLTLPSFPQEPQKEDNIYSILSQLEKEIEKFLSNN